MQRVGAISINGYLRADLRYIAVRHSMVVEHLKVMSISNSAQSKQPEGRRGPLVPSVYKHLPMKRPHGRVGEAMCHQVPYGPAVTVAEPRAEAPSQRADG